MLRTSWPRHSHNVPNRGRDHAIMYPVQPTPVQGSRGVDLQTTTQRQEQEQGKGSHLLCQMLCRVDGYGDRTSLAELALGIRVISNKD